MHRISTDKEYYESGTVQIDADGIPVTLPQGPPALSGTGFPEGRVSAPVGAVYTDTAGTAGAIRWVKTGGTGNTGWRVSDADTGWRDISATVNNYKSGNLYLRRTQNIVYLYAHGLDLTVRTVWQNLGTILPAGFRPFRTMDSRVPLIYGPSASGINVRLQKYDWGAYYLDGHQTHSGGMYFQDSWATEQAWPSTRPGIPT